MFHVQLLWARELVVCRVVCGRQGDHLMSLLMPHGGVYSIPAQGESSQSGGALFRWRVTCFLLLKLSSFSSHEACKCSSSTSPGWTNTSILSLANSQIQPMNESSWHVHSSQPSPTSVSCVCEDVSAALNPWVVEGFWGESQRPPCFIFLALD